MKPVVILSAPSGAGKTSIARGLERLRDDVGLSISATTRHPRSGERDGVDYVFIDRATFDRRIAAQDFLEWAEYGGNQYGTLRSEVERLQAAGRYPLLDIEVQGARQVRDRWENAVTVFIIPPSAAALLDRLGGRQTERGPVIRQRVARAVEELSEATWYDHIVVNDGLDDAIAEVSAILDGKESGHQRAELNARVERLRTELRDALVRLKDKEQD